MTSRVLAKLVPLAALLGLPTDTSKTYGYKPGTGWSEMAASQNTDLLQALIDGRWRSTAVMQDLTSAYDMAMLKVGAVTTALTTAMNGSLAEGGGWLAQNNGGAGSGVTRPTVNNDFLQMNTGTTATGQCVLRYGPINDIWDNDTSGSPATFTRASLTGFAGVMGILFDTLSTSTQEYYAIMDVGPDGWVFSSNPSANGCVQFIYQRTASVNWRVRYCDTSGAVKYLDTGIAVAASTVYRMSIKAVKQPDNTFVITVKINGSSFTITDCYINTSTWRSGADISRILKSPSLSITKTVGTTSSYIVVRSFGFIYTHT